MNWYVQMFLEHVNNIQSFVEGKVSLNSQQNGPLDCTAGFMQLLCSMKFTIKCSVHNMDNIYITVSTACIKISHLL